MVVRTLNGIEYQKFKIIEKNCNSSHIFVEDDGTLTFHEGLAKPNGIGGPIDIELTDEYGLASASSSEKSSIRFSLDFLKFYCENKPFLVNGWWFEVFSPSPTDLSYRMIKLNENDEPVFLYKDFSEKNPPSTKESKIKKDFNAALNKEIDIKLITDELNKCKNSPYYFFTQYINSSFWYAKTSSNLANLSEEEFNKLFK